MATLWLIGMMGAGKTTVAPIVAAGIGAPWYDTDREIERDTALEATQLMDADELRFRAAERAVVARLAAVAAVVACGGGVALDPTNVEIMRRSGLVALLDAPREVLARRLGDGIGRPLLAGGVDSSLQLIGQARRALYAGAAHVVVDADDDPDVVARRVMELWTISS